MRDLLAGFLKVGSFSGDNTKALWIISCHEQELLHPCYVWKYGDKAQLETFLLHTYSSGSTLSLWWAAKCSGRNSRVGKSLQQGLQERDVFLGNAQVDSERKLIVSLSEYSRSSLATSWEQKRCLVPPQPFVLMGVDNSQLPQSPNHKGMQRDHCADWPLVQQVCSSGAAGMLLGLHWPRAEAQKKPSSDKPFLRQSEPSSSSVYPSSPPIL